MIKFFLFGFAALFMAVTSIHTAYGQTMSPSPSPTTSATVPSAAPQTGHAAN